MTRLLTAKTISIFTHALIYILIANSCLFIRNTCCIKCFIQAKIWHNSCNNSIISKLPLIFQIFTANIKYCIAIYYISIFVYAKTAVCITIKCKSNIKVLLLYQSLQSLNMSRTAICINISSIWLVIDHICFCTKCIKNILCNHPSTSICTV